jgi:diguanylate cyclase (GGDEF)-like protein
MPAVARAKLGCEMTGVMPLPFGLYVGAGLAVIVGLVLIVAGVSMAQRLLRDRDRLCAALDGLPDDGISAHDLMIESPALLPVVEAWERMVPRVQASIAMLEWAARHDPMTDLLNSASFRLAVQGQLAIAQPRGALLVVAINALRQVNESFGHGGGDQLLCTLADRLRLAVSSLGEVGAAEVLTGRLGSDEFAVFLSGERSREEVERFIHRLQRVLGEALHIGAQSLRVKPSIGVAMAGPDEDKFDLLLAAADAARARSRAEGLGGYVFYSPVMRRAADELLEKELALRNALDRGEFCLHYQPQWSMVESDVDTVEALIRWNHPTRGLVYPGEFIPFAETYGLIDDIGDWVLLEAVRTAARWQAEGRPLRVSINVSPKQLERVELIPMIRACLTRFGLPPRLLEIEITEAAMMRHEVFSLDRIEGLRRDGVSVALDDFGTGYSNVAQLMTVPMDRLKLDRSLIEHIATDRRQQVVASALIGLARELGFEVVAEGVEDQAQFDLLRLAGCHTIQGYYLARPMAEAEMFAHIGTMRAIAERSAA